MKPSTIHTIITAKAIYNDCRPLIASGNRHSCSAGLILLQDAVELILLALLGELGIDEQKNLESKSFDELLGELRAAGIKVPKIGTIKALNKQRVITKHYGQLAEPATVRNYLDSADILIQHTLKQVINKTLNEILLTDLLPEGEAKNYLLTAAIRKDEGNFLQALIEIRKAIFVEYEYQYAINRWSDFDSNASLGALAFFGRGGMKAPFYTRNKEWIQKNVKCPADYIQMDHEKLRLDAIEWGVSTSELENLRRLTPKVFRADNQSDWQTDYDIGFPPNEANEQNCNYCLDTIIRILIKKNEHEIARRWPKNEQPFDSPSIYIGHDVYALARTDSEIVHTISDGFLYKIHRVVSGFSPQEEYLYISGHPASDENEYAISTVWGYLLRVE